MPLNLERHGFYQDDIRRVLYLFCLYDAVFAHAVSSLTRFAACYGAFLHRF